jgi:hypothetical protein
LIDEILERLEDTLKDIDRNTPTIAQEEEDWEENQNHEGHEDKRRSIKINIGPSLLFAIFVV